MAPILTAVSALDNVPGHVIENLRHLPLTWVPQPDNTIRLAPSILSTQYSNTEHETIRKLLRGITTMQADMSPLLYQKSRKISRKLITKLILSQMIVS